MKSRLRLNRPVLGLLLAIVLLHASPAFAQTTTWQVVGAGDFHTPTNWDLGTPGSVANAAVTFETTVVSCVPEPSAWIDVAFLVTLLVGYPLIRRGSRAR
jgi:hypothetical protein